MMGGAREERKVPALFIWQGSTTITVSGGASSPSREEGGHAYRQHLSMNLKTSPVGVDSYSAYRVLYGEATWHKSTRCEGAGGR